MAAQALLRIVADFFLNGLARGVNLLRRVLGNDLPRLAADFGTHDRLQILRADEFMQHADELWTS